MPFGGGNPLRKFAIFKPTLNWVRAGHLSHLNTSGAPYRGANVQQLVEEFLNEADLMALNPYVEVVELDDWHRGLPSAPIRLKNVSDTGRSLTIFCFCSEQIRRGAVVKVHFPVGRFLHEHRELRELADEFNASKSVSVSSSSRRHKPPYVNGGAMKGTYASP